MIAALLLATLAGPGEGLEILPVPCGRDAHQPQLCASADGKLALAWGRSDALACCTGAPGSPEFQRVHVVARELVFAVGMRRGPRIARFSDGRLVLTAIGGAQGGGKDGDLFAWCGDAGAEHWSRVRINTEEGSAREGLHALARGPRGELYAAWIDLRAKSPQVCGALSTDGGRTWRNERELSHGTQICPCCSPSAAFDADGNLAVMWRGERNGSRDLQLVRSSDSGQHFGDPRKLGTGSWKIDACPMDGGALGDLPGSGFTGIWQREGQVYLAGDEASERRLGSGLQPWLARAGQGVWCAWLEKRNGALLVLAPGAHEPQRAAETALDPVLASTGEREAPVFLAWESGTGAAAEIRLARLAAR